MKVVEVVAAIIKKEDKIFITRRGYGEFIDMWEFPGGKVEKGESREEALHREIKEELELEIKNLEFLTTVDYDYSNFHLTMHCYFCEIAGGELKLNAHNDAKWIALSELDSPKWVPADVLVAQQIKSRL
ncbi:MAG: (deoxy)nucleoside triphosphate pyrophosphohydrolase [Clostridiales bacterium]|nr:(deoxy)nucleoside triphosphate pyrophosphohydrolase [Clostridiales bacterium]